MDLTRADDRPVAIAGLEFRLTEFYNVVSVYGIIRENFRETLLWVRPENDQQLAPIIDFSSPEIEGWCTKGNEKVPSWSWMAYTGTINYFSFRSVVRDVWDQFEDLTFVYTGKGRCVLVTLAMQLAHRCNLIRPIESTANCKIETDSGACVGRIWYDYVGDDVDHRELRYVVVKEGKAIYNWNTHSLKASGDSSYSLSDFLFYRQSQFVLVVQRIANRRYRRRGAGIIKKGYLTTLEDKISVY